MSHNALITRDSFNETKLEELIEEKENQVTMPL